jgi:acyl-CoA synthetase (NDP forming)
MLKPFFEPKSVAIIGVSKDFNEIGGKTSAFFSNMGTAALGVSYEVFEAFCKQRGVFLAYDVDELLDLCQVSDMQPKLPRGNRAGIVTTSGLFGADALKGS